MDTSVRLDGPHFKTASERARARGESTEQYIQSLIDTDARTFDEILAPVRAGFDAVPNDELDAMFERARRDVRSSDRTVE